MYQQGLSHGQADRANNLAHQYRLQPDSADDAVPMSLDTTRVIKTIVIPTAMAMGRIGNMDTMIIWQPGTVFRTAPTTACRTGRQEKALVRRSIKPMSTVIAATIPTLVTRTSAGPGTVRLTSRDTKRAITARAPVGSNVSNQGR